MKPTAKDGEKALERAQNIAAAQDLARWVVDVKLKHGISPDTSILDATRPPKSEQWRIARESNGLSAGGVGGVSLWEGLRPEVDCHSRGDWLKAVAMWQWTRFLHSRIPHSE